MVYTLQGIAARDCAGEEQDTTVNKRLDMSEVERIRTEIGTGHNRVKWLSKEN